VLQTLTPDKDFYYDDNGYMVFTETYHLKKGYCCGHGCRHCPYNYESVPEPKRSIILENNNEQKD
jgi:hypothetical protein